MGCNLPGSSVRGIFQQEYWSGLLFPSPRGLPNPGIEPGPLLHRQFLYCLKHQGSLPYMIPIKLVSWKSCWDYVRKCLGNRWGKLSSKCEKPLPHLMLSGQGGHDIRPMRLWNLEEEMPGRNNSHRRYKYCPKIRKLPEKVLQYLSSHCSLPRFPTGQIQLKIREKTIQSDIVFSLRENNAEPRKWKMVGGGGSKWKIIGAWILLSSRVNR